MPDNKFTLIGFLIVISIIAILCSLLLPCFSNAKYMTQASRCRSSQRQLGVIWDSMFRRKVSRCMLSAGKLHQKAPFQSKMTVMKYGIFFRRTSLIQRKYAL